MNRKITMGITKIVFFIIIANLTELFAQFYIAQEDTQNGCYLSESLEQVWGGAAWVNEGKYTYAYDVNFNCTEELKQTWNGVAWENNEVFYFTYDSKNNCIQEFVQHWNGNIYCP